MTNQEMRETIEKPSTNFVGYFILWTQYGEYSDRREYMLAICPTLEDAEYAKNKWLQWSPNEEEISFVDPFGTNQDCIYNKYMVEELKEYLQITELPFIRKITDQVGTKATTKNGGNNGQTMVS